MDRESNMKTNITIYKIDSQWEFAVCLRELKQELCTNLEGWDGEGDGGRFKKEGIYVYLWLIHPSSQGYGFSSGHVWMWELDYKESWALKNWCFWSVVFEKTLENVLDCKEIQPVHPKDQSWLSIGRTDAEAEIPILWSHEAKSWLIGKDPDAGKDWRWEEKGTTEDEMVGWHHWWT